MTVRILQGDCRTVLATLPSASVHCIVTSPPYYGLRDYGADGQIGLEPTPDAYVAELVAVFRAARRVLRDDGTLWLNLGDSYARNGGTQGGGNRALLHLDGKQRRMTRVPDGGLKEKDLIGIPWRVAFALQADGWYLRQDIIWAKPNPMPESVTDRCTKAHEYVFLLSKSARYWYDQDAIREDEKQTSGVNMRAPKMGTHRLTDGYQIVTAKNYNDIKGANRRSVWTIATQPYAESHFATMPPDLAELCIKAGCPKDGTVLDPFGGAGTTGLVADRLGRNAVLIELNPDYATMARHRIEGDGGMFSSVLEAAE
jgi:DNA modification methylase